MTRARLVPYQLTADEGGAVPSVETAKYCSAVISDDATMSPHQE
jgi:hypothetical protein